MPAGCMALVGELSGVGALSCPPPLTGACSPASPGGDLGCADRDGLVHICLQRSTAGIEGDPPAAYSGRQELRVLGKS
jgi:hypothetical protein